MGQHVLHDVRVKNAQRGAVLVWFGLSFVMITGFMGFAIDVGRMYIVRSEGQAFVDAGALAAAAQLDGTDSGVTRAKAQATAAWNKYHFHSTDFSTPTVEFAVAAAAGSTPRIRIRGQPRLPHPRRIISLFASLQPYPFQ